MDVVVDDEMVEMVNLPTADTGLAGILCLSTTQGAQGPRVKWYPGRPGRDAPCLVVTVEASPRVIDYGLPERDARVAGDAVATWVSVNHAALISFWNEGLGWTRAEVNSFIDGLAKLP